MVTPARRLCAMAVVFMLLGIFGTAGRSIAEDAYPSQAIHLVVPSAAGTPPDIVSRIVAEQVKDAEGWQVIVENKPGAMQSIGASDVLKRPSDGYSLAAIALASAVAPSLLQHIGFQLDTDFDPVIKLAAAHHVLVVNPAVPAHSLAELIDLLHRQPDQLTFSSGGYGTPAHLAGELFKLRTGVRATHVPYQALPRAVTDLVAGVNQYQFITPLPVLGLISTGKLRPLAVTAPHRLPALPDVPTVVEAGFPDLIIQDWMGLVIKHGTPDHIVTRLNAVLNNALTMPAARDAIVKLAAEPGGGTSHEFGTLISSQMSYWARVVKESGMKIE
jgi:tripartite-type tricarboxylate transporter receptor subunit TctC